MLATIHCDHTKPELPDTISSYRNRGPRRRIGLPDQRCDPSCVFT